MCKGKCASYIKGYTHVGYLGNTDSLKKPNTVLTHNIRQLSQLSNKWGDGGGEARSLDKVTGSPECWIHRRTMGMMQWIHDQASQCLFIKKHIWARVIDIEVSALGSEISFSFSMQVACPLQLIDPNSKQQSILPSRPWGRIKALSHPSSP